MQIKSFSDIPEALFYSLYQWTEESIGNFNILIGVGMLLILIALVALLFLTKRIGNADERTNAIYKNWAFVLLMTIVICDIIFPKTYLILQFMTYKYIIALLVGDLYLLIKYKKDFS